MKVHIMTYDHNEPAWDVVIFVKLEQCRFATATLAIWNFNVSIMLYWYARYTVSFNAHGEYHIGCRLTIFISV